MKHSENQGTCTRLGGTPSGGRLQGLADRVLLLMLVLACGIPAAAGTKGEKSPVKRIGITFTGVGENDVLTFSDLVGAPSYNGKGFWAAGLVFSQGINRWLEWESGVEYSRHRIEVFPNLPPESDTSTREEKAALITLPFTLKAGFLKYFFVSGGILLDFDASTNSPIDSQTGFGLSAGAGMKYDFRSGLSLFVNPYVRAHSLLPLTGFSHHNQIWDNGIRIGVTMAL